MQAWAVARQMIAEGIRMKIALVFVVLIALVVLGLPFSITGDSSLTGAVQSFLSYSLSASGVLLGMLTIFMSRSLSDELVGRQIFLVMTKPISRWQFIVGKWLGITLLNTMFLATAGATIYGMVYYIKATVPAIDEEFDRNELVNEVLVARHATRTQLPDFRKPAEMEFQRKREQGAYKGLPNFNPKEEVDRLAIKYEAKWRIVPPLDDRMFLFKRILCDRSPDNYIQIRYKTEVSGYPPDEIFRAAWRVGNPYKDTVLYYIPVRHVVGRYHTFRVPANAVAADNTLNVQFFNKNPNEDEPIYYNFMEFRKADDVQVLFVVGTFGWNLVRLLVLMMCKLMFLAAVAILMTTVFSFPVACLTSFTVYVFCGIRAFLAEALDLASDDTATMFSSVKEFFTQATIYLFEAMQWILPDFGRYNAIEDLVNGRNVSLVWVLKGVGELALLKTFIVLGLAMLVFHRREVAEVSV